MTKNGTVAAPAVTTTAFPLMRITIVSLVPVQLVMEKWTDASGRQPESWQAREAESRYDIEIDEYPTRHPGGSQGSDLRGLRLHGGTGR